MEKLKRLEAVAEAGYGSQTDSFILRIHDALFFVGRGIAPNYLGCTYTSPRFIMSSDLHHALPIRQLPAQLLQWVKDELFRRGDIAV